MQNENLEESYKNLIEKYLKYLVVDSTASQVIQNHGRHDCTLETQIELIQSDPFYSKNFLQISQFSKKLTTWGAELPEDPENPNNKEYKEIKERVLLKKILSLLNKEGVRNWVACLQIHKIIESDKKSSENKSLNLDLSNSIPFALKAYEFCENNKFSFAHSGFIAGFHFDVLNAVFSLKKLPQPQKEMIKQYWNEGFKAAIIATQLSKEVTDLKFHHQVFASTLLASIGKCIMNMLYPTILKEQSWSHFTKLLQKYAHDQNLLQWIGEPTLFQIGHSEVSSLITRFVGLLSPIELAIFYYPDPNFLKEENDDSYQLSSLISLSHQLAAVSAKPKRLSHLNSIQMECMKDLGISSSKIDSFVEDALRLQL